MYSLLVYIPPLLALYVCSFAQSYTLVSNYDYTNWFTSFNFKALPDPTNGYVEYISESEAQSLGLAKVIGNQVYMGVDNTTVLSSSDTGRKSIWVTSQNAFSQGLLIGDFAHAPGGVCGTWPGFWTIREGQGTYGEIDIMEGFNDITQGYTTLHTGGTCTFNPPANTETGTSNNGNTNCTVDMVNNPVGCSVQGPANCYGVPFNDNGGGIYAMQWTSTFIRVFFFSRANIPSDILNGQPNPSQWGLPLANFDSAYGNCNIMEEFPPQTIYFDTTFCGGNAGGKSWTTWTDCSTKTGFSTCEAFVAQNPAAFSQAYWLINSVKVYQESEPAGLPISQNGQCGAAAGTTCTGSTFGTCCSSNGWCGSTSAYCGGGCQGNYGHCGVVSQNGQCGPSIGTTCLGSTFGNCCSAGGWCGSTSAYCGEGCQGGFGGCDAVSQNGQCGATAGTICAGSTFGNCCSSGGWCGSTDAYCGAGCQGSFGNCN